jgi:hypothetical protein
MSEWPGTFARSTSCISGVDIRRLKASGEDNPLARICATTSSWTVTKSPSC